LIGSSSDVNFTNLLILVIGGGVAFVSIHSYIRLVITLAGISIHRVAFQLVILAHDSQINDSFLCGFH
jgi:hypothetical protein